MDTWTIAKGVFFGHLMVGATLFVVLLLIGHL